MSYIYRVGILQSFVKESSALENKWLIRIILKNLRLKLGKNDILRAIHPKAPSYALVCNYLSKICHVYENPAVANLDSSVLEKRRRN